MPVPLFAPRRAQTAGGPGDVPAPAAEAKKVPAAPAPRLAHGYAREAAALVLIATALFTALALASFRGDPMRPEIEGSDWVGPIGALVAKSGVESIGLAAWFFPIELVLLAAPLLHGKPSIANVTRIAGDVAVIFILAALAEVAFPRATAFGAMPLGGAVGELFGEVLRTLFSTIGSYIIGLTIVSLILIGRATFSFIDVVKRLERAAVRLCERIAAWARALMGAWAKAKEIDDKADEDARKIAAPRIAKPQNDDAIIAALTEEEEEARRSDPVIAVASGEGPPPPMLKEAVARAAETPAPVEAAPAKPKRARKATEKPAEASGPKIVAPPAEADPMPVEPAIKVIEATQEAAIIAEVAAEEITTPSPIAPVVNEKRGARAKAKREIEAREIEREIEIEAREEDEPEIEDDVRDSDVRAIEREIEARESEVREEVAGAIEEAPRARTPKPAPAAPTEITIVDTSAAQRTVKAGPVKVVPAIGLGFRLPTVDMLEAPTADRLQIDEEQLKAMAQLLEKTLSDYGVSGKVEEIHPGPTVTTFEVSPAAGTKVSKVAGLADDLALGLSRKVRIIAPIPGKNRIGFEIPNEQRVPVNLRELVEDKRFQEMKAPLPCVLGRDIIGTPYFADLASMPHVIVAGATGAGKSVGLNVMLVSLLFRRTPAELKLLMIDPKVVELAPFDRIPHMLLPVVTDMKQAANALKWAVDEMERRYQLFANAGTKNITTYNNWVEKVQRGEARPPKPPAKVAAVAADGTEVEIDAAKDGSDAALPEKIPFIVIVVDEFADLMMQQGKDVEASVARLAQKARAAGMHVILATQRPSVDVITGMIKANFPTRIAFRVAQKVDSRTILDEQGAEHLLGRGDMLVKMNGTNDTRRVQCPFCSEEEVQRITDFLRLQGEPVYDENILKPRDEDGEVEEDDDAETDPMYDAAVRIVADTRRCSTSWIQRKLGVGYNRAAKIVEAMEKRGVVGPANGAKDREVLIGPL
jgi:S-DNA-T family DNA segregation ATPase FtsK/SpoIIIE